MDKEYYYIGTNGDTYGPVTIDFLRNSPYVYPTTMICTKEDRSKWFPYRQIMEEAVEESIESSNNQQKSMTRKKLGLIGLGVSILVGIFGLFMDITNGDVYNIGLMHRQSIVFFVSGFLFLGSLITMFVGNSDEELFYKKASDEVDVTTGVSSFQKDMNGIIVIILLLIVAYIVFK